MPPEVGTNSLTCFSHLFLPSRIFRDEELAHYGLTSGCYFQNTRSDLFSSNVCPRNSVIGLGIRPNRSGVRFRKVQFRKRRRWRSKGGPSVRPQMRRRHCSSDSRKAHPRPAQHWAPPAEVPGKQTLPRAELHAGSALLKLATQPEKTCSTLTFLALSWAPAL